VLGKKPSEHTNLKRVNCQANGQLYLQAYSPILDMFWITSYVVTMPNPMEEVLGVHTLPQHALQMPSLQMN